MEHQEEIQQLQLLEQNLQVMVMQRQTFQMDFDENVSAINEIKKTKDSVYKIIGQLMISSPKDKVLKELEDKQKLIEMRIKSLEKQEEMLQKQFQEMKERVLGRLKKSE